MPNQLCRKSQLINRKDLTNYRRRVKIIRQLCKRRNPQIRQPQINRLWRNKATRSSSSVKFLKCLITFSERRRRKETVHQLLRRLHLHHQLPKRRIKIWRRKIALRMDLMIVIRQSKVTLKQTPFQMLKKKRKVKDVNWESKEENRGKWGELKERSWLKV